MILVVCLTTFKKVDAKSYAVTQSSGYNSLYYLNNSTNYNLIAGNTYYADGNLTNFRWALESTDGIYKGQYLFDFYIATDSTLNNFDCGSLTTDFQAINMVTGNWDATLISSSCVYMYDTVYNGLNAKHVLYSFDFKGKEDPLVDYANEFRFLINNGYGFISNHNFRLFYGSIYDYDSAMINSFKTTGVLEQQLQNQQGIIDNQNQNTDNIINNQNQNASDIMNNQNSNTDKVLDSNKETQDKLDENKEAINDMKDSINSNLDDKFNSCRDSYNLLNVPSVYTVTGNELFNITLEPGTYTLHADSIETSSSYQIFELSTSSGSLFFNISPTRLSTTFTIDKKATLIRIYSAEGASASLNCTTTFTNLMINKGTTALPYELYGEKICTNKLDEQIKQNQTIIDSDISDDDKELPSDKGFQDYTDTENQLKDKMNQADLSKISIGIDSNSSKWIWETLTKFIQSNSIIFGMFISILSIGIIKLALGR